MSESLNIPVYLELETIIEQSASFPFKPCAASGNTHRRSRRISDYMESFSHSPNFVNNFIPEERNLVGEPSVPSVAPPSSASGLAFPAKGFGGARGPRRLRARPLRMYRFRPCANGMDCRCECSRKPL
jgi:hypothetical protein